MEAGLPSGWSFTYNPRQLLHDRQVSAGTSEAYYKALQAGVSPSAANPRVAGKTFLQSAWAVGKVNVILNRGWNSVSSPFIGATFGGDGGVVGDNFGEGDTVLFWDYYQTGVQDMTEVKRFSTTTGWDRPTVNLFPAQGCMFNISSLGKGVTRTVTLVDSVSTLEVARDIKPGWNDIGGPFPRALPSGGFSRTSASPPDNLVTGDTINEWGRTDFVNTIRYVRDTDSWDGSLTFRPGIGYWYNHVSTAGPFRWTVRRD